MMKNLYDFILNKKHHEYRHNVDWNLAEEYSALGFSAIERMADRFECLCDEEKAVILDGEQIVFLRTVSNVKITNADISITPNGKNYLSVMAPNVKLSSGEGIYLKNTKDVILSDVSVNTSAQKYILEKAENTYINGKKLG